MLWSVGYLKQAAETDIAEHLKELSDILVNTSYSPVARTAAGLHLKNHLTSQDVCIAEQYRTQWFSFQDILREYIKTNVSIHQKHIEY